MCLNCSFKKFLNSDTYYTCLKCGMIYKNIPEGSSVLTMEDLKNVSFKDDFTRVKSLMMHPRSVFVFGSNESGIHGKGAALDALRLYGAIGYKTGHQGRSYGLSTKDRQIKTLPLSAIKVHVNTFYEYISTRPDLYFVLTRVGCNNAGYIDSQISPMFTEERPNLFKPRGW